MSAPLHHAPLLTLVAPPPVQFHPDPKEQEAFRASRKIESFEYMREKEIVENK